MELNTQLGLQMPDNKKKNLNTVRAEQRTLRRANRQEDLRESLKAHAYIKNLNTIHDRIKSRWHRMDSDQIAACRLQADINFKLLSKVLPDLKMVEIQGELHHMHTDMSREEIDGMLIASGINPEEAFGQLKLVSG